jgi:hypothetical protein
MSEPAIDMEEEGRPEISWRAHETLKSWKRVLAQTAGDKRPNFERACVELLRLAAIEGGAGKQAIVDELAEMASLAGVDPDEAQETFARGDDAPPDGRPTAERSRSNGNAAKVPNGETRGDAGAGAGDAATETNGIALEDFRAYMPQHCYIYLKSREPWPASSINGRFPPVPLVDAAGNSILTEKGKPKQIPASQWLDQNLPVEQMTWAPGETMLIADRLVSHGGWIRQRGANCLNLYMPPIVTRGDAGGAKLWIDHVHRVFPDNAEHIILWLAHRVQRPAEKINHALVLGGVQGVGKDTLLEPLKAAIGPWNFLEVSPSQLLGRFNGFLKAVILRVSEARDLGDVNRYQFYDHMKAYTAAPPDVLRVDEKHLREHSILNCCGIIITTNYKTDGVYLPSDDRRHLIAWSDLTKDDFTADYWNVLWRFYRNRGVANVAAYLRKLDISKFEPKAPPPKTAAFWDIVNANRAPEDAELADVLDRLGNPNAVTINRIASEAPAEFAVFLRDRKNRRQIPHRLEACGYTPVRNPAATDGLWKLGGARQVIYAKKELTERDRQAAARRLQGDT